MTTGQPVRTLLLTMLWAGIAGCATSGGQVSSWAPPKKSTPTERLWNYAQQSEADGHLNEAARAYGELYRRSPNNGDYAHRLGVVFALLGDDARSQNAYARARQINPNNPELLIDMGYAAYLNDEYAQAEELLKAALALAPGNSRAVSNLALAVGYQGRDDECLALLQRVYDKKEIDALCNLAFIQSERGDTAQAIGTYQQALKLDPHAKQANQALAELKSQQKSRSTAAGEAVAQQPARQAQPPKTEEQPQLASREPVKPATREAEPAAQAPSVTLAAGDQRQEAPPVLASAHTPPPPAQPAPFPRDEAAGAPRELSAVDSPSTPALARHPALSEISIPPQKWIPEPPAPAEPRTLPTEVGAVEVSSKPVFTWAEPSPEQDPQTLHCLQEQQAQIAARHGRTGFMGFCPVALRDEQKLVDARSEFRVEYRSHVYEFSSSEAKQKFAAAPERYTASASGLDVVAINQGTTIALGSLEHALWFRHKLYLFLNEQNKEQFRSQCRQLAVEN